MLMHDTRSNTTCSVALPLPADRATALQSEHEAEQEEADTATQIMAHPVARTGAPIPRSSPGDQSTPRRLPSLQPSRPPPRPRRKRLYRPSNAQFPALLMYLFALTAILPLASAVFINFDNCLDRAYREEKDPVRLQFKPMYLWATFDTNSPKHAINVTVYGNVTGQAYGGTLPPPPPYDNGYWSDPTKENGKILDVGNNNTYSTLFANFKVVTYTAFNRAPAAFCESTVNSACPLGPSFQGNASDPATLSGWTIGHDFHSSYSFATFAFTTRVLSGDASALTLACVSANITPDLGSTLADTLCYLPAAILALVAIATVFAAICSPWGTSNIFRWTSNYGRDEDLLRLVTPGFGDCLQYIQFIVLAGSLNLQYPGFFQPVVSQASWSVLLFNESLVSQAKGSRSLIDGIYFANGTYGISRLGQYVGISDDQDIWAGMAVWLLGIIAAVVIIIQLGFLGRWAYRTFTNTQDSDLRGKNWPFTAGNVVRIVFNFFLLPIVSISLFQLVVSPRSPASVVGTSVILLLGVLGFASWIFWLIFTTRPRAHLFDDLPTVLTYGPLYNTYSDDAAPFAFIPVLLTIIRGIAIGAIQPSGIAQIIVLAICEVVLILTIHAFRPFQSNTSMNAYHTFFSAVRLTCCLLMVAFVPSLGVAEESKGWIGYAVLLLHGAVLVFGFFLNSVQTLIEVAARLAGAGQDQRGGLASVFGKRQLKRRTHRKQRSSMNSAAAMLPHDERKQSIQLLDGRPRSTSGSSAVLLSQYYGSNSQRASVGFDQFSQGDPNGGGTPGTPGTNATPWSYLGGGSGQSSRRPTLGAAMEASDPYYRPPRARKATMDSMAPGQSGRGPSTDLDHVPYTDNTYQPEAGDAGEGPSSWSINRNSITPAYLKMHRDDSDPALAEGRKNTDYSVRESDFYYGLRGPALSAQPTRKLKTGPADPMSPVASATGWLKSLNLFGGPKKEKGKGFEVVRSTRLPPQMMPVEEDEESPPLPQEPYHDSPTNSPRKSTREVSGATALGSIGRRMSDSDSDKTSIDEAYERSDRVANTAPTLGPIDTGGGIELPSRIGSRASRNTAPARAPSIPRRSSRRTDSRDGSSLGHNPRLSAVVDSSPNPRESFPARAASNSGNQHLHPHGNNLPIRLPFGSPSDPSPSPERSPAHSAASSEYRHEADLNQLGPAEDLVPPQMIEAGAERPLSTGYVHQHMAGDSIHNEGYDAGSHLETSAEFVDRSRSFSTQHSNRSHRSRQ